MSFIRTFIGSFYDAALYRRLRYHATGAGIPYMLTLLLLAVPPVMACMLQFYPEQLALYVPTLQDQPVLAITLLVIGLLLARVATLAILAIAMRLAALKLKPWMDYPTAFRLVAVAYTPVAVADTVFFCLRGLWLGTPISLVLGFGMVLAVLIATKE